MEQEMMIEAAPSEIMFHEDGLTWLDHPYPTEFAA
jgi:hypothetical protein